VNFLKILFKKQILSLIDTVNVILQILLIHAQELQMLELMMFDMIYLGQKLEINFI
jgi:hypothetical protein